MEHQLTEAELSELTHWDSQAIRAGCYRTNTQEHSEALFLTSSYCFESAQQAASVFAGEEPGSVYSRYTNPTVDSFQQRLAALEGGEAAAATASGMAAIFAFCLAHLQKGDHVLVSKSLFGTTLNLFEQYVKPKLGVEVSYVSLTKVTEWQQKANSRTRMLFLETPSNPLNEIADLKALATLSRALGAWLVVDNCLCTPALQRPLALGADIVIHSATKFLDGQGRCLGGAVVGSKELIEPIVGVLRTLGPSMSPFNAWVFLKGLETLKIRMQAQSKSAMVVAQWLSERPQISRVHYAGLEDSSQHVLAGSQQSAFGAVLSFEVKGGREAAWKVIDSTRMLSITGNLGDTKTTITHPATTTHGRMSDEDKQSVGISENLIRLAIGLEHVEDICADLARGL